jgi:hypothetical protein
MTSPLVSGRTGRLLCIHHKVGFSIKRPRLAVSNRPRSQPRVAGAFASGSALGLKEAGTEQSDDHRAHRERCGSGSACDGLADAHPPRQHQPRDRCSFRDLCARSTRRPVHRPRRLFNARRVQLAHWATRYRAPHHVFRSSKCRSRRARGSTASPGARLPRWTPAEWLMVGHSSDEPALSLGDASSTHNRLSQADWTAPGT